MTRRILVSRRLLLAAGACTVVALVGCSQHTTAGPSGSGGAPAPSGDLELVPAMYVGPMMPLRPIADGDAIGLSLPPQGGHVLFVGARMKNLATDTIQITARVLDPDTGDLLSIDQRTVVVRPAADDPSVVETDPETYTQQANVAVCPDKGSRAVDGGTWTLEVEVHELYAQPARTATERRMVVPTCPTTGDDAARCACECAAGYVLGKCPAPK